MPMLNTYLNIIGIMFVREEQRNKTFMNQWYYVLANQNVGFLVHDVRLAKQFIQKCVGSNKWLYVCNETSCVILACVKWYLFKLKTVVRVQF